ncbi:MAG: hypothetical protein ISS53_06240 [Dehalococcoidia bacterium]|nr:hypothetical protein [Dehalococcoidia bacterium]
MTRKSISPVVRERKSRTSEAPGDTSFVWQGRVWRAETAQQGETVTDEEKQLRQVMADSPVDQTANKPASRRGEKRSRLKCRPDEVWDGRCLNCNRKVER